VFAPFSLPKVSYIILDKHVRLTSPDVVMDCCNASPLSLSIASSTFQSFHCRQPWPQLNTLIVSLEEHSSFGHVAPLLSATTGLNKLEFRSSTRHVELSQKWQCEFLEFIQNKEHLTLLRCLTFYSLLRWDERAVFSSRLRAARPDVEVIRT